MNISDKIDNQIWEAINSSMGIDPDGDEANEIIFARSQQIKSIITEILDGLVMGEVDEKNWTSDPRMQYDDFQAALAYNACRQQLLDNIEEVKRSL